MTVTNGLLALELPELERVCPVTQKELVFVGEKQSEVLECWV